MQQAFSLKKGEDIFFFSSGEKHLQVHGLKTPAAQVFYPLLENTPHMGLLLLS